MVVFKFEKVGVGAGAANEEILHNTSTGEYLG